METTHNVQILGITLIIMFSFDKTINLTDFHIKFQSFHWQSLIWSKHKANIKVSNKLCKEY